MNSKDLSCPSATETLPLPQGGCPSPASVLPQATRNAGTSTAWSAGRADVQCPVITPPGRGGGGKEGYLPRDAPQAGGLLQPMSTRFHSCNGLYNQFRDGGQTLIAPFAQRHVTHTSLSLISYPNGKDQPHPHHKGNSGSYRFPPHRIPSPAPYPHIQLPIETLEQHYSHCTGLWSTLPW